MPSLRVIAEEVSPETWSLFVTGDLDGEAIFALHWEVLRVLDAGASIILLDLHEAAFVDSTGIRELVEASTRMRSRGGRVAVIAPSGRVRRSLELSRVDDLVPVFSTRADALAAIAS